MTSIKKLLQTANLIIGLSFVSSYFSTFYSIMGLYELSIEIAIASAILIVGGSMILSIAFKRLHRQFRWTAKVGYIASILLLSYALSSMFVFAISVDMRIPYTTIFILVMLDYIAVSLLGISFYMLGNNTKSMLLKIGGLLMIFVPQLGAMLNYIALRKINIQ